MYENVPNHQPGNIFAQLQPPVLIQAIPIRFFKHLSHVDLQHFAG